MADDALKTVVTAVTSDRKRWLDFMMHFELGLEQPDSKRAPISAGTIAASYVVGGLIPLAPYVVMSNISKAFAYSVGFTALEATSSFHLKGWRWWINAILPGIFPYYVTGAITASGGSWNASIVAEVARWGDTQLTATGLGAYIATATAAGDFPRVVLGVAIMCVLVTLFNRLLWRPLYAFGERRLRLG